MKVEYLYELSKTLRKIRVAIDDVANEIDKYVDQETQ
jgi:hypothetical protein